MDLARLMWTLYEPVHSVTYFAPEAHEAYAAVGLRGFWRSYFAGRAAPLGPVGAAPVVAAFFNFAPRMVARALPDVWQRLDPEQTLRARSAGAVAALARVTADLPAEILAEAADRLSEVAGRLDQAGRVLGAANGAVPTPAEPLARLWQAATTLREHRGDGHVAALVATGLSGCDVLAWRAAYDMDRDDLAPHRGWTDEEWTAASERLVRRGWLDETGSPSPLGVAEFERVEAMTDTAAAAAWSGVDRDRLIALLTPIARACRALLPPRTPLGLPETPAPE